MNIKMMISRDTGLKENQVAAVLDLLDQGSTVPFIARYRKERTGSLDEVAISDIRDRSKASKRTGSQETGHYQVFGGTAALHQGSGPPH